MLKTVSSITNAIGALNFKGTWNASTNTPTLTSGVGVKGDYFVVSTAGTTNLDGISTWGIGDWATYNGTVWQRVEGGADLEGVNLSVSGTTNLAALTASTAMALDANKNVVSVTNTGTGNNVLGTSPTMATPTLTGDVQMSTGNLVIGTSGKGIDFSADGQAAGMTSELLDDYEEGTWTPVIRGASTAGTYEQQTTFASYTKTGRLVAVQAYIKLGAAITGGGTGLFQITGLPFAKGANTAWGAGTIVTNNFDYGGVSLAVTFATSNASSGLLILGASDDASWTFSQISGASANDEFIFTLTYEV
jgi:hypothetical protein